MPNNAERQVAAYGAVHGAVYGVVLIVALIAVAHGAIFVRAADAHPIVIAAFRLGIATAVLLPITLLVAYAELRAMAWRQIRLIVAAAVFLTFHFATWTASLDYTSIANAVVLVTLIPVWLALYSLVILRVQPSRLTWLSVALAVTGGTIIALGSAAGGDTSLLGDLLALAGGLFFAGFLLLAETIRQKVSLLPFVTLAYGGSAILLWAAVAALGLAVTGLSTETYGALIAVALFSQVIGHTGINWAVRAIPPTLLAVAFLIEPVMSALLGLIYFGEGFGWPTAVGGVLVLAGIWLGTRADDKAK